MRATYFMLFIILFIYSLILAKAFLVPLSFGLLFSSLIFPVCRFLCKLGLHKRLSIFISVIMMGIFFAGVSILVATEINDLVTNFPMLRAKAIKNVNEVALYIQEVYGIETASQKFWLKDQIDVLFSSGSKMMNEALNATAGTIFKLFIIPVFVYYLLFYNDRFHFFILRAVPDKDKYRTNKILTEISFVSQRYFGGAFVVVLILAVLNSIGLYIIGVKYSILFGVISAFCNFIPYFGTWIGSFFPIMFSLFFGDSPDVAVWVFLFFAFIHFIESNILTPNITGGYVRLNPFFTILGLLAGGMVWGVAGMLLVIPFMASLKIIFENFESTKTLAFLIGRPESDLYDNPLRKIRAFFIRRKVAAVSKSDHQQDKPE
jgi:predicted PurR-regulated permease PerM